LIELAVVPVRIAELIHRSDRVGVVRAEDAAAQFQAPLKLPDGQGRLAEIPVRQAEHVADGRLNRRLVGEARGDLRLGSVRCLAEGGVDAQTPHPALAAARLPAPGPGKTPAPPGPPPPTAWS